MVLLETAIVAHGLPAPHNLEAALNAEAAIRETGAIPATVAVLDGALRIGVSEQEIRRLAQEPAVKVSTRDLGWAIATRQRGATTVAATVRAAGLAGLRFMATGGIGGVHLGRAEDVSADLYELAQTPCAVFCAGPKSVLNIGLTLERLESYEIPVLGYQTDVLPTFYARTSAHRIPCVGSPSECAEVLQASWGTGLHGVVVAVTPPHDIADIADLMAEALARVGELTGPELTPRLLRELAALSDGRTVTANVELVVNNARHAADVAVEYARR